MENALVTDNSVKNWHVYNQNGVSMVITIGGKSLSTSSFVRRRKNGLSHYNDKEENGGVSRKFMKNEGTTTSKMADEILTPCSSSTADLSRFSYFFSSSVTSANWTGSKKFIKLNSSRMLFCRGVPVNSTLFSIT